MFQSFNTSPRAVACLTGGALILCASFAFSQGQPAAPPPAQPAPTVAPAAPPVQPAPPAPTQPAPAAAPTTTAPVPPPAPPPPPPPPQPAEIVPSPVENTTETPPVTAEAAPAQAEAVAPLAAPVLTDEGPEIVEPQPNPFSVFLFADANYAVTSSHRDSGVPPHRAYAGQGADGTIANGFSLEWVGMDVAYNGGEVAANASLRFGDGVIQYFGDRGPAGIANLTQGYVTWMPHERVALDLGQFGTIFGAEVAESWLNLNYTRGGLYFLMQPFFHTGLKGSFAISDSFGVNAMIVNGVNSTFDEDDAPSVAVQAAITPGDAFELYVGGLQTIDSENDSSVFDTFLDLVALIHLGDFTGVINANYNMTRDFEVAQDEFEDTAYYGVSVGGGYAFSHLFGAALRYELLGDPDNMLYGANPDDGTSVNTLTGTIDLKPLPERDNLVIRWDNRFEFASEDIYRNTTDEAAGTWFMSVLGVVVKMDE